MTFEEFKKKFITEILWSKAPSIRSGQSLMSYLHSVWPKEYDRITSINFYDETDIDCFYNDKLIDKTLNHLEKNWTNYPN